MTQGNGAAVPAATLILFRGERPSEHLFVERSASLAFAGGAVVFPGGRVEADDQLLAHHYATRYPALAPEDAAARIAAIRETLEEAGIAVGMGAADEPLTRNIRDELARGARLSHLLDSHGLALDLEALTLFARWCPPDDIGFHAKHRFDTRFYICRAPDGREATVDQTENARLLWSSAENLLALADAATISMIFPTRRNVERLATFADYGAALAQLAALPPALIQPRLEERDGQPHLCIPDGQGYPIVSEAVRPGLRR